MNAEGFWSAVACDRFFIEDFAVQSLFKFILKDVNKALASDRTPKPSGKRKTMNWTWEDSEVRLNPRHPFYIFYKNAMQELARTFKGHIWLATSGSSAQSHHEVKWAALSKEGLLISAAAVNDHLQSTSKDIWINPLPEFHVGGLGIFARAYLSKATVIDYFTLEEGKWNAIKFHGLANECSATLTSLVPAQVYDLIIQKLRAPSQLRAVIVGGGALSENLYYQALEYGWKLFLAMVLLNALHK